MILLIDENNIQNRALLMDENRLVKIYIENKYEEDICDNIYVGKIKGISDKMKVAFVDIGFKKEAIMPLFSNQYTINQDVIVQVSREAKGNKGPRVKDKLQLKGRYIILNINSKEISISTKNKNFNTQHLDNYDGRYGYIIRTNTTIEDIKEVEEEYYRLSKIADGILQRKSFIKPPYLIYKNNEFYKNIEDEILDKNIESIKVNNEKLKRELSKRDNFKDKHIIIDENIPYFIEEVIKNNTSRVITMKNGGSVIVDLTEAFTIIDVNSSLSTNTNNAFEINKEACDVIIDFIIKYNLNGNILIDFIDLDFKKRKELEKYVNEIIEKKNLDLQVFGFTKLGIMEASRKRYNKSFFEKYYDIELKSKSIYTILREIELLLTQKNSSEIYILINNSIYLQNESIINILVKEIEKKNKTKIKLIASDIKNYKIIDDELELNLIRNKNNLSIIEEDDDKIIIQIKK
ncbi:ribonuclease E/G [Caloramator proteoclasticus]|uniref:Ribonuclease G n=1 Tax=Caloramator proteoclasticus DSM 10124 TaxID=1121262 RepID=A0A1M4TIK4_9CLOT|nr:ribonuclease E/G [Caloramator proteoclasticus]SHE44300.1 ribonuclease G [Caloramator proteoclasticus DSM 10124]